MVSTPGRATHAAATPRAGADRRRCVTSTTSSGRSDTLEYSRERKVDAVRAGVGEPEVVRAVCGHEARHVPLDPLAWPDRAGVGDHAGRGCGLVLPGDAGLLPVVAGTAQRGAVDRLVAERSRSFAPVTFPETPPTMKRR